MIFLENKQIFLFTYFNAFCEWELKSAAKFVAMEVCPQIKTIKFSPWNYDSNHSLVSLRLNEFAP